MTPSLIQLARRIMKCALENEELKRTYVANIAMLIYDQLHEYGYTPKLKFGDREAIAENILELIFKEHGENK